MRHRPYLEGFIPYEEKVIKKYRGIGAWRDLTYGDLLDRATRKFPDKIAVIDDRIRLTYVQLKEKVDIFAIALLELGVKRHDRLVLQLSNRCEFVIAFYGMQKIGAIPVLAIPRHGYTEISNFIATTEAVGWIVQHQDGKHNFRPIIQKVSAEAKDLKVVILPEDGEAVPRPAYSMEKIIEGVHLEDYPDNYLDTFRPDPNDVTVLIPTGGTTGFPKLVPRTHNSLIVINEYASSVLTPDDVLLLATPAGHAAAMSGPLNQAMFMGATLVLQGIPRPRELLETIEREKVTFAIFVPTQIEGIMNDPDLKQYDLSSLRYINNTAAKIHQETTLKAIHYFSRFGCIALGSGLGASEGLLALCDPQDPIEAKLNTVGRNVTPGSHYKVIDEQEQELPSGVEGELVAKGPEVFTGYYRVKVKENKEFFTHDGYYKTGDLAIIDEEGFISMTGRIKDVIIRGGETLLPGEMEKLIRRHPDVDDIAVVGMPDENLGEKACAYVVFKEGRRFTFDTLIAFLRSQGVGVLLLPERMEIMGKLPVTSLGKIDKKALRADILIKLKEERTPGHTIKSPNRSL